MIQVVDVYLEAPLTNVAQKSLADDVSLLWYELERALDPKRVIDIHQLRTKVPARCSLHIVGYHRTALGPLGPEPDERNSLNVSGLHRRDK
jgi:hypothetical protein